MFFCGNLAKRAFGGHLAEQGRAVSQGAVCLKNENGKEAD